MKHYILFFLFASILGGCSSNTDKKPPEPHLELGQRLTFVGANPESVFVVVGYRHLLEDKTDKTWNDHEYIVVSYANNQGDIKTAAIHRNAVLKR